MNIDNLNYLLENNPYSEKNYYKNIPTLNIPIQEKFLKSSKFKYRKIKGDIPIRHKFRLFDLEGNSMFEIKELKYPNNGRQVRSFVENKLSTENYLMEFGINTPHSKVYHMNDMEKAKEESFKNTDEVVIKPLSSSRGRGVQIGVVKDRFEVNWNITKNALRLNNKNIIVQNVVEGFEARVTIIEGQILSIIVRIPPFVSGNNINTIRELIKIKNNERKNCDFRKDMLISETESNQEFLKSQNLDYDYIPGYNENVLINSISNIVYGGESIDITDLIGDEVKEAALDAMACIPNLNTCGIDIMMESFEDEKPVILEVNSYPFLSLPFLPTYGKGKNPTKYYIESLVSLYQFINKPRKKYYIENELSYVENYLRLNMRRQEIFSRNYKRLVN